MLYQRNLADVIVQGGRLLEDPFTRALEHLDLSHVLHDTPGPGLDGGAKQRPSLDDAGVSDAFAS